MIAEPAIFTCSICGEPSSDICAYCTKDACANHRCTRCKRCSDCCECEVPLSAEEVPAAPEAVVEAPAPPSTTEPTHIEVSVGETELKIDDAPEPFEPPPDSEPEP